MGGPEKTSFFQALSIPTKITKGTIEIINDVELIKAGDKVGMSEATLLNMLKISPFTYGLVVQKVYDSGSVFDPEILDITDDDLKAKFMAGVANVAAVSLAISYPTVAAVTDISFKEAETLKEFLADPSKFAAAAAAAPGGAAPAAAAAKEPEPESEEEDDDMGFALFD